MSSGILWASLLMQHETWPVLSLRGLPETVELGQQLVVRLPLLGVVPLWRHTITVVDGRPWKPARRNTADRYAPDGTTYSCRRPAASTPTRWASTPASSPLTQALAACFYLYRHRRCRPRAGAGLTVTT